MEDEYSVIKPENSSCGHDSSVIHGFRELCADCGEVLKTICEHKSYEIVDAMAKCVECGFRLDIFII